MDPADTLAESLAQLTALSSEIKRAALVDSAGVVLATAGGADGEMLARVAAALFDAAPPAAVGVGYVEVSLGLGSVFAVRDDRARVAVATTSPEPASALVLHDLRGLLRRTADA